VESTWERAALVMASRPAIPASIKREVEQEAGYRCAIPTCRDKGPFDFEHIDEWSKVKKHEFHNIILLCVSCHARVTRKNTSAAPISKEALRKYKRNLAIISGRYSLFEMRILETLYHTGAKSPVESHCSTTVKQWILVAFSDQFHLKGLIDDGVVNFTGNNWGKEPIDPDFPNRAFINLTAYGVEFVNEYFSGKEIS